MERAPGAIIAGRYRLVDKLGSGGMGAVWLCQDLSLDSTCAVKIIDPEKSRSEEVRKRFIREAKAAAQLRGPHVVDVFDRGEFEGLLYIAMEHLEGEDLCTRLALKGRLDAETTYRVIAHVARALSSAHALGIVHRDLKPENIFLVPGYDEEVAKVLDFGIAQHEAYRIEDHATREGAFLGTPYYVSPEQARGKPTDHRSDLWSLGVIAYQCLTGSPPFESDSLGELMGLILYEPIPKITEVNPELPPAMEAFWSRAIERDREQRFQSARELADALGRALGVKSVVTVPTLPPRRPMSSLDGSEVGRDTPSFRPQTTPRQLQALAAADAQTNVTLDASSMAGADPLAATDQAVTRTRPSIHSLVQGVESGYGYLKRFPKKPLVVTAVAVGMLVGGFGVYGLSTRQPSQPEALANELPSQVTQPEPVPRPAQGPEVVPVIASASASAEEQKPPPKKTGITNPAGKRAPAGTPDYGI